MIAELVPFDKTRVGRDLIAKGRAKGLKEGREQILTAVVVRMSRLEMTPPEIAEFIGLPLKEICRVIAARSRKQQVIPAARAE